ncbi:MAG TPA: malto-oligosyltrehalose synthase [Stellaceae bacterium]|nr:malto-oligosyltrehalose synthase [Stellaceae bacterium]
MSPFDIPIATYRLQFNCNFTFDDAAALAPYLASLGISHVYASPFLKARAGSTHGYDVVDYHCLNPEIGDDDSFARFRAALAAHGLGLIVDFVPNHMGVGKADNAWWLDVLEWGQDARHARYFDIDWHPAKHELDGKVLVPILGRAYGEALADGEIALRFCPAEGTLDFWYFDHRLPLCPRDYPAVLAPILAAGLPPERAQLDAALRAIEEAALGMVPPRFQHAAGAAAKHALTAAAREPATLQAIMAATARYAGTLGDATSFAALHALLERQNYRLAHWRAAADEINYRRFFDIINLAGIRMDRVAVFRDAHEFLGHLVAEGALHGLRIDHVDGMADPQRYCRRLNAFAAALAPRDAAGRRWRPYIVVEKILGEGERLPVTWPVSGTTGYDYLALANAVFVDPDGHAQLVRHWRRFTASEASLESEIDRCRRLVIDRSLASELTYLVDWLQAIAEASWFTRDFTRKGLRDALIELVAAFPVYRTYVTERGIGDADRRVIERALRQARRRWIGADAAVLDFIASLLTLDIARERPEHFAASHDAILRFVTRFQQYTGAIAAKAVEDTLFYRVAPLASANEVGADPRRPSLSVEAFHHAAAERLAQWPNTMLASETHDTKRAEDIRARLNVLSEFPDEWARRVARWREINAAYRTTLDGAPAPSPADEYLIYQTILGAWPVTGRPHGDPLADFRQRIAAYALKAVREAKVATSWTAPNDAYERALGDFVARLLSPGDPNRFLDGMARFAPEFVRLGAINGLAQLVLKATQPGVPDFYRGSEFWDMSLVDPDNRRPVDFAARRDALLALKGGDFGRARRRWREGWLKLWLTQRLLGLRAWFPDLFRTGSYHPLTVDDALGNHVIAYARRHEDIEIIVLVCRLTRRMPAPSSGALWSGSGFGDAAVRGARSGRLINTLSGAAVDACERGIVVDRALAELPVAVLCAER